VKVILTTSPLPKRLRITTFTDGRHRSLHAGRLARLRVRMREHNVAALVVSLLSNVRYLTGFTGSHGIVVVTLSDAWFLTDTRYRMQSAREVRGFSRIITMHDPWTTITARGLLDGCRRVAFESEAVTYAHYALFRKAADRATLVPSRDLVEGLAIVKDAEELASIGRAVEISDCVFLEILPLLRPGVSELEIAAEISYRQRCHGAEGDAFEPIVASGSRGALPHARASGKTVKSGELITLDFGCTVNGYCSDLTRTIGMGRIERGRRQAYATILAAQREAIDVARAGMAASELDAVARTRIAADGLGRYFTHSLGHGLGLRIHERPRVSHLSTEKLQVGSVITIEPGIYIPERYGVRIEDDIVLTSSGCSVLTTAPKELLIL
jgi:Xaa-Pro aminopeptidase